MGQFSDAAEKRLEQKIYHIGAQVADAVENTAKAMSLLILAQQELEETYISLNEEEID